MKTRTTKRTTRLHLVEKVTGAGRIDRQAGIIRGVKILGRRSMNRRTYSDSALDDAARLYENVKVNLDHPSRDNPTADRPVRETVGVLKNVKRRGDAVYGDLHLFRSHPDADWILERAEAAPKSFGLSQNAHGQVSKGRDGEVIVERIDTVHSVDLVDTPATVAGLFESLSKGRLKMDVKRIVKLADSLREGTLTPEELALAIQQVLDSDSDPELKLTEIEALLAAISGEPEEEATDPDGDSLENAGDIGFSMDESYRRPKRRNRQPVLESYVPTDGESLAKAIR